MITFDDPCIDFEKQPQLGDLVRLVCDDEQPITIFCGAGVSVEGGFPTWPDLVDRMCDRLPDSLQGIVRADPTDPMRKVEYVFQATERVTTNRDVIRAALYQGGTAVGPGFIADAVARLAVRRKGEIRIATTNFDNQLERALSEYVGPTNVQSYSISECDAWYAGEADKIGVLHLHGLIQPGRSKQLDPVLLSESQFQEHGSAVRNVVLQILQTTSVLFVGVGLSDPNLVGPLSSLKDEHDGRHFILAVNERVPGHDPVTGFNYLVWRTEYLRTAFKLQPIRLKAYSQVAQVLYDLTLALTHRKLYLSDYKPRSLRYGHRFERVLRQAYGAAGVATRKQYPEGAQAHALSEKMRSELARDGGVLSFMSEVVASLPSRRLSKAKLDRDFLKSERFAAFLWLRSKSDNGSPPRFSLRLIGSSAYVHWESWSFNREHDVVLGNHFHTDAAFLGSAVHDNLRDTRQHPLWSSVLAMPITRTALESLDVLSLGVISLHSTRCLAEEDVLLARIDDDPDIDIRGAYSPSALTFFDELQQAELRKRLSEYAKRLLAL